MCWGFMLVASFLFGVGFSPLLLLFLLQVSSFVSRERKIVCFAAAATRLLLARKK
jgi:hypothetical protein